MVEDGEMPTAVISEREAGRVKRRVRERESGREIEEGGGVALAIRVSEALGRCLFVDYLSRLTF